MFDLSNCFFDLKQVACTWNAQLVNELEEPDFEQCSTEPCLFRLMAHECELCTVAVYLDDFLTVYCKDGCVKLKQA